MQILVLGQILTHSYINCLHFQVSCSWHNYYKVITIAANSTAEGPNLRQHRKNRMKTGRNTINSPRYNLYTKSQNNEEVLKSRGFILTRSRYPFNKKKDKGGGGSNLYAYNKLWLWFNRFQKIISQRMFFFRFWVCLGNTRKHYIYV